MEAVDITSVRITCLILRETLKETSSKEAKIELIENYLKRAEEKRPVVIPAEVCREFQWINVLEPLNINTELKGKIIILDFFTYCCINCLHLLPALKLLEEKFSIETGVVVIGVHSAKFTNEKTLENVKNAVLRNDIHHPVINDSQGILWDKFAISCWPTLLILGPNNELLFELIGEHEFELLELIVRTTLDYYCSKNLISSHSLPLLLLKNAVKLDTLSFPSKICLEEEGNILAISDTGHHRIIIVTRSGKVLHRIGGVEPGMIDGTFEMARFNSPQGLAWQSPDVLYVADTWNHAIRKVNFNQKQVLTVAGTGAQGNDIVGGDLGTSQVLNSPWDICIGSGISEGNEKDVLYIAMAGIHQIWALFLNDAVWLKKKTYMAGTCVAIAGSGKEENRNNFYPNRASFAQPSGICFFADDFGKMLIIADSESSTVRMMSLQDGIVKGIAGGSRDPMNLFAYGDIDGKGTEAKLQHPLDVVWNPLEKLIYVCDSYNHKIKIIDWNSKICHTYAGSGLASNNLCEDILLCDLNEPSGIDFSSATSEVYIADTNNHVIKILNTTTQLMRELQINWNDSNTSIEATERDGSVYSFKKRSHYDKVKKLEPVAIQPKSSFHLKFALNLRDGYHLTPGAPQSWHILTDDAGELFETENNEKFGKFSSLENQPSIQINIKSGEETSNPQSFSFMIEVEANIFFCSDDQLCFGQNLLFQVPIIVASKNCTVNEVYISHTLP